MKVVVTGASGFLGRHVVHALARMPGIYAVGTSRRKVAGLQQVVDYRDAPAGDVLIHLAETSNRGSVNRAGEEYETRALAVLHSLMLKDYAKIVYASSAALYGNEDLHAHDPDDPVHLTDRYARVKRLGEMLLLESANGMAVRLSNVYGPGMSAANVISTIVSQVPGEGPVEVMDTEPVRDFLWVEDAAAGMVALARQERLEPRVFNLGTGVGTSIGRLAREALRVSGQPEREVRARSQSSHRSTLIVSPAETTRACGWLPRTMLSEGLHRLLEATPESDDTQKRSNIHG